MKRESIQLDNVALVNICARTTGTLQSVEQILTGQRGESQEAQSRGAALPSRTSVGGSSENQRADIDLEWPERPGGSD